MGGLISGVLGVGSSIAGAIGGSSPSASEEFGRQTSADALKSLNSLTSAGAGAAEVATSLQADKDLASQFQALANSGGLPSDLDIDQSRAATGSLFKAQEFALQERFRQADIDSAKQRAVQGRSGLDPVLQAKLLQEQTRQSGALTAEKESFAGQLALGLGERKVGFASQGAAVQRNLASQAFQNRATIAGLGSNLASGEASSRRADQKANENTGFAGGFAGGIAGLGVGLQADAIFNSTSLTKAQDIGQVLAPKKKEK